MTTPAGPYLPRAEAGLRLAEALERYRGRPVTVVALPRGGVPLASIVAGRLGAPLDILIVRKVGAPGNREFGLGAVAEGGVRFLDPVLVRELGLEPEDLEPEIRAQTEEVARLARRLRGGRPPVPLQNRVAVLVDDGMATGGTVKCAVQAVRLRLPSEVVVAVGVSSREALRSLESVADAVVCPLVPPELYAVGEWYREFPQVSDAEVVRLLERHWFARPSDLPTA